MTTREPRLRIVIAPDSFKESLSSAEVADAIEAGFREVLPACVYVKVPVADGGEGTVDALVAATHGRMREAWVTGPLGEPLAARYGLSGDGLHAFVEMAAASGLMLVPPPFRDPLVTTTFGVGELILAALDAGARRILIGVGGSATNDGGAGMAQALGVRLLDAGGEEIGRGGGALAKLARIDATALDPRVRGAVIEVACDVDVPLVGPQGASAVFGPQKGAGPAAVAQLDTNLSRLATHISAALLIDVTTIPGGGAAGGLAAGLLAFAGARLRPGAEVVMDLIGLDALVAGADVVITGEGQIDGQSVYGKTPVGVAAVAKRHRIPVIGIAGSLGTDAHRIHRHGIDAIVSVLRTCCTMEQALADARINVQSAARNLAAVLTMGLHVAERERSSARPAADDDRLEQ